MKLRNIFCFVMTELIALLTMIFCIAVVILLPIYIYTNGGGWSAVGSLSLLAFWTLFCLGLIFKE